MKTGLIKLLGSVCMNFAFAGAALAVTVPDGVQVSLPGTTWVATPSLAGVVLEDRIERFSYTRPLIGGVVSGTVRSRVLRSNVTGKLDFYWRITVDPTAVIGISTLVLQNFVTPVYDANWRIDSVGEQAPFTARRTGNVLTFDFTKLWDIVYIEGITPGESSKFVFLRTNATSYALTGSLFLTGLRRDVTDAFAGLSVPLPTFQPVYRFVLPPVVLPTPILQAN